MISTSHFQIEIVYNAYQRLQYKICILGMGIACVEF